MAMNQPAVFLDRDGTVVENVPYNGDPEQVRLAPGAGEGLRALQQAGYQLVVVSNQSGVARGLITEEQLVAVSSRLFALLLAEGVLVRGMFYCPHHPDAVDEIYRRECECRKPLPGLLQRAAAALDVSLGDSWMVGDILDDVEAGHRAGTRAVLVGTTGETEWKRGRYREPDYHSADFADACRFVVQSAAQRRVAV